MRERVRITDVSPRDGLQNEPGVVPARDKVRLIEMLSASGVDEVEVTSFVSPKWVPQLADAGEVVGALAALKPVLSVLVPNEAGMTRLLEVDRGSRRITKVSVFTAASETFSKKNTNATIAETLERFAPVVATAQREGLAVRGYISCVIACPFDGPISPPAVLDVARRLLALGVDEIDLGDTIGAGTPQSVGALVRAYAQSLPLSNTTLHLHDTFGRAAECVRTALELGVRSFDGSVAGLGGCPYAGTPGRRAPGNISTETLVRTVHEAGFETGVDAAALARAGEFASGIVAAARSGGGGA